MHRLKRTEKSPLSLEVASSTRVQSSKELRKVSKVREISPVQFCIHTAASEVLNQLLARQNRDDGSCNGRKMEEGGRKSKVAAANSIIS